MLDGAKHRIIALQAENARLRLVAYHEIAFGYDPEVGLYPAEEHHWISNEGGDDDE
jgi:hypothetical protein